MLVPLRWRESLVIGKAVHILVVLIEDFEVVLAVSIRLKVVKKAEQDLERDERVRSCLMLGAHSHDVQLLCNLFKATVEVEAVHERLDVKDVGDVVLEILLKQLSGVGQILVHHELQQEAEVLIAVEADPGQAVV